MVFSIDVRRGPSEVALESDRLGHSRPLTVDREAFLDLALAFGIPIEKPVPHPPLPGQTETVIPPGLINAFNATIRNISVVP